MSTDGSGDAVADAIDGWLKMDPQQKADLQARSKPADRSTRQKAHHRKEQFVMLPMCWKDRLRQAQHAGSLKLALHLHYLAWKTGERSIQLSNAVANDAGVTRRSKWRALSELDQLGLVVLERRGRRSPIVTILIRKES
jgi:hypothetical protein